jgi:tRNA (mo5U34)-methyltransferase
MTQVKDPSFTNPVRREKRIRLGGMEFGITVSAEQAEKIRNHAAYRYLLKPTLSRLAGSAPAKNGDSKKNGADGAYRAGFPVADRVTAIPSAATSEARAIIEKISGYEWYHTIDLPHGVSTPGYVDHRAQLPYYELPEDMTGMRVLDVATFDGFWAFEFERRGAEVIGIDLNSTRDVDVPRNWRKEFEAEMPDQIKGEGFRVAKEILGAKAERKVCSVYDVSPEKLGMFDMTFCSDMLIHIRDPLAAIEAIWTVVKAEGFSVFADVYHPELDAFKENALMEFANAGQSDVWWRPNSTAYRLWLHLARYSRVDEKARFNLQSNFRSEIPKIVFHAYK